MSSNTRFKAANGYQPERADDWDEGHATRQATSLIQGERMTQLLQRLVEDAEMDARTERAASRRETKQQHSDLMAQLGDLTAAVTLLAEAVSAQTPELTRLRTELRLDNLRREETEWDERVRQAVPTPQVPLATEMPRRGRKPWSDDQRRAASERMTQRHAAKRAAQATSEVPA